MSRPYDFDYSIPDDENMRCPKCNKDGMNRTGFLPICYMGASTTCVYVIGCPNKCNHGLKKEKNGEV